MRAWFALAVLIIAGCATPDEGTPSPTPSPTPTPTASPTPEPSPTPTPTATPEPTVPSGTPIPPPPKIVYNRTFDFSTEGDATGQRPKEFTSDPVSAEFALLRINVTLARSNAGPTGLPVSGTISAPAVRILDPDGVEVFVETEEGAARDETTPSKVGAYTVRYEGAGTLKATVVLTASS